MNMMTTQWMDQAQSLPFDALVQLAVQIAEQPRPMPPAWMIAPNFRGVEQIAVTPGAAEYPSAAAPAATQPYRSIREVPRIS